MMSYPATWAVVTIVVATVAAILVLLEPPGFMIAILLGLAAVSLVGWPLALTMTGTLNRLQFSLPQITAIDEDEMAKLADALKELEDPRPTRQLQSLTQKRDNLADVLGRRLDAGEVTYARYLTTAQQVYESTLDNLHEVAVAQRSISAIDGEYIDARLAEITAKGSAAEADESERKSLEGRRALRDSQQTKVAALLAENEAAMTLLDRTATSLANAPIGRTPEDAKAAMAALEELADRASRYATG
jgi:biopolymer transport protein ExbB/TolQ